MRIPSGVTDQYIYFVAVDSTDFVSRETGLSSFTVYRSRNGGASSVMTTPTINETDVTNMPGVYELLLDEDMTIDAGDDTQEMCFHITQASMAPVTRTIELYRSKITAGNTLGVAADGDVSGNVDGNVVGSTASVTGAVGSVTGNVGGDVQGNVDGSTASVTGAVGSVTGNVGGTVASVVGAVGSVTGAVGSVAGNVDGNVTGTVGSVVGAVGSVTGAVGSVTGNVGGDVAGNVDGSVGALLSAAVDDILDEAAGIETGLTVRQGLRLMAAALYGKLSGADTVSIAIRDTGDNKDRITATVDADGNRSAVTLDAS